MVAVYTGSGNLVSAMFNSDVTSNTKEYLVSQYSSLKDTSRFGGLIKSSFERLSEFTSNAAVRLRESVTSLVGGRWDDDIIKELTTLREQQLAKGVMQRWMMANPTIRELQLEQRCNAYSNNYEDPNPKLIGVWHDDYRCVKTGLIEIDEETTEWVSRSYFTEQTNGDEPLLRFDQRAMINNSWIHQINHLMANDGDPTSEENNDL